MATAQAAATLLMSFPEDLQRNVMSGFDPSGTKDGNVWGRLLGYIRSQWSRRLGLQPEASGYVRQLPEEVQLRIMMEFDINSRDGSNSQRLLAFAQQISAQGGNMAPAAAAAPTSVAGSTRPSKWGMTAAPPVVMARAGVAVPMETFAVNLGLDTNQMFFLQALHSQVQEQITAAFDPSGTKDGNVWGRLLAMVRGVWARHMGVDRATFDQIKAMPEEQQMTTMIDYSNMYPSGAAGVATAGYATQAMPMASVGLAGYGMAGAGLVGATMAGYGMPGMAGMGMVQGMVQYAAPVPQVRTFVAPAARGVIPPVSRGGGGEQAVNNVLLFAQTWGLDQNVVEFMMAIPDQVRDAVVQTFDGSGTKDGNVWGRLLGFVRQTWSRFLGLDPETSQMIRDLPIEAQVICMKDFDPSGTKDGNVAGRLQGFARKAVAVARMGGAVIPSGYGGGYEQQTVTFAAAPVNMANMAPPPSHDLTTDPVVVGFLDRCNLDLSAASMFADLPEDILQQAINEFDPSGTKDGNVLGRLQGYVRHLCRKRGLGDPGSLGPDPKRARMAF